MQPRHAPLCVDLLKEARDRVSQCKTGSTEKVREYLGVLPEVPGLQSAVYLWQALYPRTFPKRYKLQLWKI